MVALLSLDHFAAVGAAQTTHQMLFDPANCTIICRAEPNRSKISFPFGSDVSIALLSVPSKKAIQKTILLSLVSQEPFSPEVPFQYYIFGTSACGKR
uniref:Uncharacterized protein n=1 Tax=Romanomermis culicivorax TaxID=13658 RepID=A0A915HXF4_ROMCU